MSILILILITSCKSEDTTSSNPPPVVRLTFAIEGLVSKGPVSGSTVTVYRIIDGVVGSELASTTTDMAGAFTLTYNDFNGPVLIMAEGGQYSDEATGSTINLDIPLRTVLSSVSANDIAAVTPLTELTVRTMAQDYSALSIDRASQTVSQLFSGAEPATAINVSKTIPADATGTFSSDQAEPERRYGLLLAMLSQYTNDFAAQNLAQTLNQLEAELANDDSFSDSTQDNLADSLAAFLSGSQNVTGVTSSDLVDIIRSAGDNIPEISDVYLNVAFDTAGSGKLLGFDASGENLTYAFSLNGSLGTASVTDLDSGEFTYTPNTGATGTDQLSYTVTNDSGFVATAEVIINIADANTNSAPTANNDWLDVLFATATNGSFNGADADNDQLTFRVEEGGSIGTTSLDDSLVGTFTYQPYIAAGNDVIRYQVNDGLSDASNTGQVKINILGGNPLSGGELYIQNCESCHTTSLNTNVSAGALKASIGPIHDASTLVATDVELGDISAWLYGLNTGDVETGGDLYDSYCAVCHGGNSASGPSSSLKAGRSAAQIRHAIISVPTMNSQSFLTVRDLENLAAWLNSDIEGAP